MSSPALYLNTITIKQASSLKEKFRLAKSCGYQGLELWMHEVAPMELNHADRQEAAERYNVDIAGTDISPEQVNSLMEAYDLSVCGLCPASDAAVRWQDDLDDRVLESLKTTIQTCCGLGGQYVILPILGEGGTLEGTAENLKRVGEIAEEHPVKLGLEPVGHVKKCNRVGDALRVLELSKLEDRAGLVLDSFHFFRGGQALSDLAALPPEQIVAVHINDGMDRPRESLFGHKHRVYPGSGIWNISGFCRAILEKGYDGHFVVEILNEEYWQSDAEKVCRMAYETSRQVIQEK